MFYYFTTVSVLLILSNLETHKSVYLRFDGTVKLMTTGGITKTLEPFGGLVRQGVKKVVVIIETFYNDIYSDVGFRILSNLVVIVPLKTN